MCEHPQEVAEPAKVMGPDALLKQKIKQKRFRDGYAEGLSSLHRQTTAATFIASEHPVEMLGQFTRCGPKSIALFPFLSPNSLHLVLPQIH